MLREVLEKEADALAIDLKNVSLVDREAVKLLARCETNGTELRNCPPYIRPLRTFLATISPQESSVPT